jgi:hypothetical protein
MNFHIQLSILLLLIGTLFPASPIKNNNQTLLRPTSTLKSQRKIETHGLRIDTGFPGGNVVVEKISNDTVYFKPDLRDTEGHWFYWNFRVTSNKPQTWYFKSTERNIMTGLGAAYSRDGGYSWDWIDESWHHGEDIFQFTFAKEDETVRLSMGMAYTQDNFDRFIMPFYSDPHLKIETLCTTKNGRNVEQILVSDFNQAPSIKILVTARAHACEMMGNYVIEGMLSALLGESKAMKDFLAKAEIMFIPFLDKDGVEQGDQGKNRQPRDHNRDYSGESIYASTKAIRQQVPEWVGNLPWIGVDLHNPWIKGENNEWIYFVGNAHPKVAGEQEKLVDILEASSRGRLKFNREKGFLPFGTAWNTGGNYEQGASFGQWASTFVDQGLRMTTTLEFPYALNHGQVITQDAAREFGEDLIYSLAAFLEVNEAKQ